MTTPDPTKMANQPSLSTANGTVWLVVGGIFAAISLGVLIPMTQLSPPGLALAGAIGVAVLYVAMIVVRFTMAPGRRRLTLLAVGMLAIAAIALVIAFVVASVATLP